MCNPIEKMSFRNNFHIFICTTLMMLSCSSPDSPPISESEVTTFIDNLFAGTGGVTIGPDSNIYVSDFGPVLGGLRGLKPLNKVFKISPSGDVEIFVEGIYGASGSKFDEQGNFYQSNVRKGVVTKVSTNGSIDSVFIEGMTSPVGVSLDVDQNIYINNCGTNKIIRVNAQGVQSDFCTDSLLNCPNGLTRDDSGNFYVANFSDGNIVKISPSGKASLFATLPGKNNGHILFHDGQLYVIARAVHQIYSLTLDGKAELFAGSGDRGRKNGDRLTARFSYPNDLDISPDGKYMYVNEIADTVSDHRVLTPMTVRRIEMD